MRLEGCREHPRRGRKESPPGPGPERRHGGLAEAPYNVYPTQDGWIAIICVGDVHWSSLISLMQRPDLAADPRFGSLKGRVANMDEVDAIVSGWTSARTKENAFQALMGAGVPCAPVRDLQEVMNDPNMHARGALQWQNHPEHGRIVVPHSPLRFAGVTPRPLEPSHALGADTAVVLRARLGWDDNRIARAQARPKAS